MILNSIIDNFVLLIIYLKNFKQDQYKFQLKIITNPIEQIESYYQQTLKFYQKLKLI